jgi:predicted ester cyclase
VSTEEGKAVVRDMVEKSMIASDVDAAIRAYAPDFAYPNPVLAAMPGLPSGPEAVRQLALASRAAFPDMRYTVEALIAEDDKVAVLYTWRGTQTGSLGGMRPTGRSVSATGAIVCRVAGRKIVEQWDIDDRLDVMQQLGLIPTAGQPEA